MRKNFLKLFQIENIRLFCRLTRCDGDEDGGGGGGGGRIIKTFLYAKSDQLT